MKAPLVLGIVFATILVLLPVSDPTLILPLFLPVSLISIIIPLSLFHSVQRSLLRFYETMHPAGKFFLVLQGVLYFMIVQNAALLCTLDHFAADIIPGSHNILLLSILVITGAIAVIGHPTVIARLAEGARWMMIAGLVTIALNVMFFQWPMSLAFDPALVRTLIGTAAFGGVTEQGIFSLLSMSIIVLWLFWISPRILMNATPSRAGVVGSVVFILTFYGLFALSANTGSSSLPDPLFSGAVMLLAVGGLIGLILSVIVEIGAAAGEVLYPMVRHHATPEQRTLVTKLAMVFTVILSILMLPAVRAEAGTVVFWFLAVTAVCAAPQAVAVLIAHTVSHRHSGIVSVSVMAGTAYAAAEVVLHRFFGSSLLLNGAPIITVVLSAGAVTALLFVLLERTANLFASQKVIVKNTNTTL